METKHTNSEGIKDSLKSILTFIGDDPDREGLRDTPDRIIRSWSRLYGGYAQNPDQILSTTFVEGSCDEMIILKDIEFYSTCEHHFLPFFGKVSIGYIPN